MWDGAEEDIVAHILEASGWQENAPSQQVRPALESPYSVIDVQGSTYVPGSRVFAVMTSELMVMGSAVVSTEGDVSITVPLPLSSLSAGEHRIRLLGERSWPGMLTSTKDFVQLSADTITEITYFDPGTQVTVLIEGTAVDGGRYQVERVVTLPAPAPWWTLWLILVAALIGIVLRLAGRGSPAMRRLGSVALALGSALPGVVLGWLSTVTVVAWWALGLGVMATLVAALGPYRRESATVSREPERLGV
jgi:hypothetical protein